MFQAYMGSFRTIEIFLIPQTSFVNPIISPFTGMTFKEGKPQKSEIVIYWYNVSTFFVEIEVLYNSMYTDNKNQLEKIIENI